MNIRSCNQCSIFEKLGWKNLENLLSGGDAYLVLESTIISLTSNNRSVVASHHTRHIEHRNSLHVSSHSVGCIVSQYIIFPIRRFSCKIKKKLVLSYLSPPRKIRVRVRVRAIRAVRVSIALRIPLKTIARVYTHFTARSHNRRYCYDSPNNFWGVINRKVPKN